MMHFSWDVRDPGGGGGVLHRLRPYFLGSKFLNFNIFFIFYLRGGGGVRIINIFGGMNR